MKKKILIITPKLPFPKTGACEQDRGYGIEDMIRLDYDVRVIAKISQANISRAEEESKRLNIQITAVPYRDRSKKSAFEIIGRLIRPWTWDGAAYEYYEPVIQAEVEKALNEFQPDLVWFEYSFLWPLYSMIQKKGIPIITRSQNFEPKHFLQEDGASIVNLLKFIPKLYSEYLISKKSDLVLSITPQEELKYKKLGANVRNLPLRGLPHLLALNREIAEADPLHVFFFGSTYNVHHNRNALRFLLTQIVPLVNQKAPGAFAFHILGAKIPSDLESLCIGNIAYEGFVQDLNAFLDKMDIAVIPSLMGAGMQQKIFEPLARGISAVISPRGMVGYAFIPGHEYVAATTADEFAAGIISLQDIGLRRKLSENALKQSKALFSQVSVDTIVDSSIKELI